MKLLPRLPFAAPGSWRPPLRPTAAGASWLLACLALLATAINYGNNLIFALCFLLLAVWLQAAWHCRRHLAALSWLPDQCLAVFAGEDLLVGGRLHGGRAGESWAWLSTGGRNGEAAVFDEQGECNSQLLLPTQRRGALLLDDLRLHSSWPLGLWLGSRRLSPMRALVYPQPAGALPLPGGNPDSAHRLAASDDFQGLRPYAPGDTPRRINWRVFSRRGELMVNRFDGSSGGQALWLDWEAVPGEIEARLAQLTAWLLATEHAGQEYGLRLPGQLRAPGRGRSHREACLEALALHPDLPERKQS